MTLVKDWRGSPLSVGAHVLYGAQDPGDGTGANHGVITAISDPDGDYDDELGRGVLIPPRVTVRFDDGSTDTADTHYDGPPITWSMYPDGPPSIWTADDLELLS